MPAADRPYSSLSSRLEARPGVFDDQLTLEFVEGGRDMEEQPPLGRAGVDVATGALDGGLGEDYRGH
jgi:hypothetical protein